MNGRRERVAVFGAGRVGLVTAACLAEVGHTVVCIDRDTDKIDRLRGGETPIYEPGLEPLIRRNEQAGRLAFTVEAREAVGRSDVVIVAVGTPPLATGDVDLAQVWEVADCLAESIDAPKWIAVKSTVPVGTCRKLEERLRASVGPDVPVYVVSNPEFLREGSAIDDTFGADRVVVGCAEPEAGERIRQLYEPFGVPVFLTDRESAELIKYAANAFLAMKISFINEIANICEKVGADVESVAKGIGMDRRIGPHFLRAGIGYGGSCFPKDTTAQLRFAENVDYEFRILRAVVEVNRLQRLRFVDKIETALGGVARKRIALLGLTFKPDTDDLRDSPALDIANELVRRGASVCAFDPVAYRSAAALVPGAETTGDLKRALAGADAVVVATEWEVVRALDLAAARSLVRTPIIIDGRNVWEPRSVAAAGWRYVSVGRPEAGAASAVEGRTSGG
ncbi:MAG: UDP-glucose 6-dehydrogenase [Candidatus Reconcilbacillus cellulovorans]|uniref:UDP-glucose 6-dehydrogenase n=1 Tax=Candidatus Reconcilbacillus cellulovorans TaxID=1906605 RepID=A0A2A6E346_9BACL|nr:MAG: UDP-glucose 6-dehydrogenase [Candidatus Reconcilbacillus cellulovorans]